MKTLRLLVSVFLIALLACFNSVIAQTKQIELHADFDHGMVWCLEKELSGSWTYHITYHINKETGEVDNLHWNLKHARCEDEFGNKYNYIDTGSDKLGFWWGYFNNINAENAAEGSGIQYDEPDGWLNPDLENWPTVLPEEGMFVNTFKFVGKGEKVTWRSLVQVHMNANGEITAEVIKETIDCN